MRTIKKLTGLTTSAFLATAAMAHGSTLEPYRCPEPSGMSITETWMQSQAREWHYNSGGSAARQERGKTYGAFMDAFWSDLDIRFTESPPSNAAELFDGIGASYLHAYETRADASLAHGVTPQLFLDTAFRNRTENGGLNNNDIILTPADLEGTTLSQNPELQQLLPFDGGSLDNGINISVRFMPTWGDYLHQPIAGNLGQFVSMNNDTPIEQLLGFSKPERSYTGWTDETSIKDSVICRPFN